MRRGLVTVAAVVVVGALAWFNGYGYGFDAYPDISSP